MTPLPLTGLRIVDLSRMLAGPFGTLILGDLGADVIKVEPPQGDMTRVLPPHFLGGDSLYYLSVNRNKKSVCVDLRVPAGRQVIYDLARTADAVYENYAPGVTARLGIDPSTLQKINPNLIYCSVNGFGSEGPLAHRKALDLVIQGMSGGMSITGLPGMDQPVRAGIPLADLAGGLFATIGLLAALLDRARTGRGHHVDVGLLDTQIAMLTYQASYCLHTGQVPGPQGSGHPSMVVYQAVRAKDGWLVVVADRDEAWARFCQVIGRPDLAADPELDSIEKRVAARDRVKAIIEPIFRKRTVAEWVEMLEVAEVASGPVYDVKQALEQPQVAAREMVVELSDPHHGVYRVTGNPVKIDGFMGLHRHDPPPVLGQHTAEVLSELLGYSAQQIDALAAQGAIRGPGLGTEAAP